MISFWRELERDTASLNVDVLQVMGAEISKNIVGTFRCFQELDDIKLFKDYQMYFQFAVVQLHILNDQAAFDLYVGKMKSILEINKMFERNFQSEGQNSDYANFIIVDANGQRFGQILQLNNTLRQLLGWKEQEHVSRRIESFMPTLIKKKHHSFLERYNKTGQSFIINNRTCMFVKKASGFVIPVELLIKFHYSIDHQYVFLAILTPMFDMAPFSSGVRLNIGQLIFVLADNEEGRIFEYSESCRTLLKLSQKFEHDDGPAKTVGDLVVDFDFAAFKRGRQQRYFDNVVYEDEHALDLGCLADISDINLGGGLQRVNDALL